MSNVNTPRSAQKTGAQKKSRKMSAEVKKSSTMNKSTMEKTSSTSDSSYIEKLHHDLQILCNELKENGYDSMVVVTSGAEHSKFGSERGQTFLEDHPDFIEEFCHFCRDNIDTDEEDIVESIEDLSKLHVQTKKDEPGIHSKIQDHVERTTKEILDADKTKKISEDDRNVDRNETDDDDAIEDDGDGDMSGMDGDDMGGDYYDDDVGGDDDDDYGDDYDDGGNDDDGDYVGNNDDDKEEDDDNNDYEVKIENLEDVSNDVITIREPFGDKSTGGSKVSTTNPVSFLEMAMKVSADLPEDMLPPLEKPYTCSWCNKKYGQPEELVVHERMHTGERPFKCATCGRGFRRQSTLKQHSTVHNKGVLDKSFICEVCGAKFTSQQSLYRHKFIHSDDFRYRCGTCNAGFKDPSSYNRHILRHTGTKKHFCDQCDKGFLGLYELKCHKLTHSDTKNFVCKICAEKQLDKRFRTKKLLKMHNQRIHLKAETQVKPYVCDLCDLRVTTPFALQRHKLRRHAHVKTHYCQTCGKGFLGSYDLKCHLKVHSGEKSHQCEICEQWFRLGSYLNKHKRLVHGIGKQIVCK